MIHKISFKNFYSFMDEANIDLMVDKNAPDTDAYFGDSFGNRLTKFMAFVGPNASGKTSLLKSIGFINWFTAYSFVGLKPDEEIAFKPFLFCSDIKPSNFSIEFEIQKKLYKYEFELTVKKVLFEKLSIKEEKRFRTLFERKWEEALNKYKFNFKGFDLPADFSQFVRPNASIISTASQIRHKESLDIVKYFNNIQTNIIEIGKISTEDMEEAIEYYQKHPEIKSRAEEILSKFDLGLSKINIHELKTADNKVSYFSTVSHKYIDANKEFPLPIHYESKGTQNLVCLLRIILSVLERGGVAVLDEMDNDLHPFMVQEIVALFSSKTYNPKNAQLLFSTHSVQILNRLDKQQITLVEKDNKGISEAWNLSDIKGVRSDDNFYSKYMSGAYGATPKI